MIYAVIGSHFGDEGKGLATDYFASKSANTLVVRHNGGAQSGHTVEDEKRRFIFHELSSGSFRGADTYWAATFFPDIFKLKDELTAFYETAGFTPRIFASPGCSITTIDDILINMLLESSRGKNRHGSCGMGINEAFLRSKAGFSITLEELSRLDEAALFNKLTDFRNEYTSARLKELSDEYNRDNIYYEMLSDSVILSNFSHEVNNNKKYVTALYAPDILFPQYENVIFETGQGLRLDAEFKENYPNVTASRTGLTNIQDILKNADMKLDEVIYVSRSYLTKHGAGDFPNEDKSLKDMFNLSDNTNTPNEWQGTLRYSAFDSPQDFIRVIKEDKKICPYPVKASLMITHLNKTGKKMIFRDAHTDIENFIASDIIKSEFDTFYLSESRYADDIYLY